MSLYSTEQINEVLKHNGFIIVEPSVIINKKILCFNSDGYKVLLDVPSLIRRGSKPEVFSKSNPYTIENIEISLKNKESKTVVLSTENIGSSGKYMFRCECGTQFSQTLMNMVQINKSGLCPKCSKTRGWDGRRVPVEAILDAFNKRGYIIQGEIPRGRGVTQERIPYICSRHTDCGVQYIRPDSLMNRGDGCMYCGIERRGLKHRHDEEYLREITESAGFVYMGTEHLFRHTGFRSVIQYICPEHSQYGIQHASVSNMKRSNGRCKYCVNRDLPLDGFLSKLKTISPSISVKGFVRISERMIAICSECGHEWSTIGTYLLQGKGCPSCCSSLFEKEVYIILRTYFNKIVKQKKFEHCRDKNVLPFDFYLPEFRVAIEADGEGHYMPINFGGCSDESAIQAYITTMNHDKIKNDYCLKHNILLIRIPYWERRNLETFLLNKFKDFCPEKIPA